MVPSMRHVWFDLSSTESWRAWPCHGAIRLSSWVARSLFSGMMGVCADMRMWSEVWGLTETCSAQWKGSFVAAVDLQLVVNYWAARGQHLDRSGLRLRAFVFPCPMRLDLSQRGPPLRKAARCIKTLPTARCSCFCWLMIENDRRAHWGQQGIPANRVESAPCCSSPMSATSRQRHSTSGQIVDICDHASRVCVCMKTDQQNPLPPRGHMLWHGDCPLLKAPFIQQPAACPQLQC